MAIVYSTLDVHPRDRLSYWLEVATRKYFKHEFRSTIGRSFVGSIRSEPLGALDLAICNCDPCEVIRSTADIASDGNEDIFIILQLAGSSILGQEGRQTVLQSGSFAIMDSRRPSESIFPTQSQFTTFRVPREAFEARLGSPALLTARALHAHSPLSGLAANFLSLLSAQIGALQSEARSQLGEQVLDLVALAFTAHRHPNGVVLSSARSSALLRLKSAIEAHLCDPELKPAAAAAAAGISVRYANALLSQEGYSIERYILHQRLDRCRRALEDPRQAHRMIGEIAYSWGFSDTSHFGRRFREDFGVSPSEYRQKMKEPGAANGSANNIE